jgi:hypothetical protein
MMKARPKTGFKQKNDEELMKVNVDDVEKYVELLYEEKYEDKVKGARSLLFLITDPGNIVKIITDKNSLFDVLSRTLREEHKKSIELLIHLLAFYFTMSYYDNFHPMLSNHSIGGTCMSIIEFQFMKYAVRKDELVRKMNSNNLNKADYQRELERFLFLVRKQDRILRLAFTILMHLAEDPNTELKMVKKDIVALLIKNLDRCNVNLIVVILLFLKKLSIFQVNKDMMVKLNILDSLMK